MRLTGSSATANAVCAINEVREKSGCAFKIHDCRRTFLTLAERINTPHYVLKKLVNHSSGSDVTAGYIIVDVERLRGQMARISERILAVIAGEIIAPQESVEDQTKGYFLKHTAAPNGLVIEIVFAKDMAMA